MMLIRADAYKNVNALVNPLTLENGNQTFLMGIEGNQLLMDLINEDLAYYKEVNTVYNSNRKEYEDRFGQQFAIEDVLTLIQLLQNAESFLKQRSRGGDDNDNTSTNDNDAEMWKDIASKCMIFCQRNNFPVMYFNHMKTPEGHNNFTLEGMSQQRISGNNFYSFDTIQKAFQERVDNAFCMPYECNYFRQVKLCGSKMEFSHLEKAFGFICKQIHTLLIERVSNTSVFFDSIVYSQGKHPDKMPMTTKQNVTPFNKTKRRQDLLKFQEKLNDLSIIETSATDKSQDFIKLVQEVHQIIEQLIDTTDDEKCTMLTC
jgi:hypothetical protein